MSVIKALKQPLSSATIQLIKNVDKPSNEINLVELPKNLPEILESIRQDLKKKPKNSRYGLICAGSDKLSISVSSENGERALKIVYAIYIALTKENFKISESKSGYYKNFFCVNICGNEVFFRLSELTTKRIVKKDDHDRIGYLMFGTSYFEPTGTLCLEIGGASTNIKYQKLWRDSSTCRLENKLNDFIKHLYLCADGVRINTERLERYRIEYEENKELERRQKELERAKVKRLSEVRDLAVRIQEYQRVEALSRDIQCQLSKNIPLEMLAKLKKLNDWVNEYLETQNPYSLIEID